ncbi:MAG: hypothetical protein AAGD08_07980 [Pseudomonadota bacterium]
METVERGHAIMSRERSLFLAGDFRTVESMTAEKQSVLADIEALIPQVRGTPAMQDALQGLIRDSRRNERIIAAARHGIAAARRRIQQILAARQGAVAYDRYGKKITSRADAVEKSSSA